MANVPETPSFDAGIYQIETTDPVLGGPNGIANAQAKGLANRTAFLKQQIDRLNSGQLTPAWIASQDYVQGELQKLDAKQSVRAATTANITLSGVQTIDGVVLTVGERVLVKDQNTAAQNGIYLVAAQSWTRATDADDGAKLNGGASIAVESGTINAGSVWYLSTTGTINVGSTALTFINEHRAASSSSPGVVILASVADAIAGSDEKKAVTPKGALEAAFSAYPVGAPIPWPTAVPPAGFLAMTGQSFSAATYPKLALAYPSLVLPDLRASFIRGWDNGLGVDASRQLLTLQQATSISEYMGKFPANGDGHSFQDFDQFVYNNPNFSRFQSTGSAYGDGVNFYAVRPRNRAFNYIVRAA
ncbi:phage tail protein [Aeromonas caviae]|uniref:phage tail protein n=1 Tax=Aeromonas caviae TaxID=648 RepID=UPI00191F6B3E|nr:phage tail protein [Aeromonas caviae]MBL0581690.1 tail fiber protein [Aeromonas caviae]